MWLMKSKKYFKLKHNKTSSTDYYTDWIASKENYILSRTGRKSFIMSCNMAKQFIERNIEQIETDKSIRRD